MEEEIRQLEESQRELLRKRKTVRESIAGLQTQGRNLGLVEDQRRRKKLIVQGENDIKEDKGTHNSDNGRKTDVDVESRQNQTHAKTEVAEHKDQKVSQSGETEKGFDQSHYIINDESVKKRNKNMFGGIMSYLKKAKTTLEKDESTLKLQQENYARIDQRQEEESKEIKEKQRTEIEDKRAKELAKKKEIELELIRVDQEVLLKKIDLMYTQMGEYILTKTQPPLFWKPNKSHEDITKLLESSNKRVDDMKQKHIDQTTEILAKVKEEYLDFINKKLDDVEIKPETVDNKQEIASDTESSQEIKKNSEDEDSKAEAN